MSISIANNGISSSTGTVIINGDIAADNLADVAFSGEYSDLKNVPSGGQLVASWSDKSGSWYRKYDDGWIEQGGRIPTSGAPISLTFHIPFSTTLYGIGGFAERDTNFNNDFAVMTYNRTANGVTIESDNETQHINWLAYGY